MQILARAASTCLSPRPTSHPTRGAASSFEFAFERVQAPSSTIDNARACSSHATARFSALLPPPPQTLGREGSCTDKLFPPRAFCVASRASPGSLCMHRKLPLAMACAPSLRATISDSERKLPRHRPDAPAAMPRVRVSEALTNNAHRISHAGRSRCASAGAHATEPSLPPPLQAHIHDHHHHASPRSER